MIVLKYKDKKKYKKVTQSIGDKIKLRVFNIVIGTKDLINKNKTLQDKTKKLKKEKVCLV